MNTLISLLLTAAMLLSGASGLEDSAELSSRILTLSDIVVRIDEEEYPVDLTPVIGISTEGEEALIDFYIESDDAALLPIQAKIDESGISALIGSASTAYTFDADYLAESLGLEDIDLDDLTELADADVSVSEDTQTAIAAICDAMIADYEGSEVEFTINDTVLTGTNYIFTLDHDTTMTLVDDMFEALGATDALASLLGETADTYEGMAAVYASMGAAMTVDVDLTTCDSCTFYDMTFYRTLTAEDEEEAEVEIEDEDEAETEDEDAGDSSAVTYELPMSYLYYDDGTDITVDVTLALEDDITVEIESIEGDYETNTVVQVYDDAASLYINVDNYELNGSTTNNTIVYYSDTDEGIYITFLIASDAQEDGTSVTDVSFTVGDGEDSSVTLAFTATVSDEDITDRISDASFETIASDEDLDNASGLMLAVLSLATDLETIMSDDTVAALVDTFSADLDYDDDDYVYEDDEEYIYDEDEEYIYDEDDEDEDDYGNDDPADLSFTVPDITALPDGYELYDYYIYADYEYAVVEFDNMDEESDDYYAYIMLTFSYYGDDSDDTVSYQLSDGTQLDDTVVSITRYAYDDTAVSISASCEMHGMDIYLNYYGLGLSDEEVLAVLRGLDFDSEFDFAALEEETEETEFEVEETEDSEEE